MAQFQRRNRLTYAEWKINFAVAGQSTPSFTRNYRESSIFSRKSLPVRKKGTCFSGTATGSPVRGLRPARDLRCRTENAPKPRSSTRAPRSNVWVTDSRTTATTRSMSRRVKCGFSSWSLSINSDLSMRLLTVSWRDSSRIIEGSTHKKSLRPTNMGGGSNFRLRN